MVKSEELAYRLVILGICFLWGLIGCLVDLGLQKRKWKMSFIDHGYTIVGWPIFLGLASLVFILFSLGKLNEQSNKENLGKSSQNN